MTLNLSNVLAGAVRSKLVYTGLAAMAFTYLANDPGGLSPLVDSDHVAAFAKIGNYLCGLLTILFRVNTDESLADVGKAAKAAP